MLTKILSAIGARLLEWAPWLAVFIAGRKSVELENEKAQHEATKREAEAANQEADIMSDPIAIERMHNEHRRD